eukprot:TRINITY_DN36047_c0_g1_i1.p2 TRINITY_DN36047_c0_g1~~TRINITY_DN36047_c0_g1_i1.p2  ORF type:complete len:129 (+),score=46.67 TRINITY_DN36047_c0_g1_i1:29-388(+)
MHFKFKEKKLEERKSEAARIAKKYPDGIPVICEKHEPSDVPDIDKTKYLVPTDLNVGQFMYVVRKRIKLDPEKAIFLFVEGMIPTTAALMQNLDHDYKDEDGFLDIKYTGESTYGADEE